MGKKKKDVVRCNACGVKATRHVVSNLHVCSNIVCEEFITEYMKQAIEILKRWEAQ